LDAHSQHAKLIVLPECFNSPYSNSHFRTYSEEIPAPAADCSLDSVSQPSLKAMSELAVETSTFIIAGSIPEREASTDRLFNTSVVFNPQGQIVAKHRKAHLFDIDIPGKITFMESKTLSAGNTVTTFETPFGKIGLGICYDLRFPEYAQVCANLGCEILCYPGAFNTTTGPLHWELLLRARALDNQLYVLGVSPARLITAELPYPTYGHSTAVGPWGDVLAKMDELPAVRVVELDLDRVREVRAQIPIRAQKRFDLYTKNEVPA